MFLVSLYYQASLGFETPIRIAFDEDSRNFAVGCIRSEPCRVGEIEEISSSVKIIDRSFNRKKISDLLGEAYLMLFNSYLNLFA